MKKHSVLITGVGGNIGQGVLKSLRVSRHSFHAVGVDMDPLSAGFSLVDRYEIVPKTGSDAFEKKFKEISQQEQLEAVYVCSPSELEYFSTRKEELEKELRLQIFVNPVEVCRIGEDKLKTAEFLKRAGLAYPETALAGDKKGVEHLIREWGFPLLVKPCKGFTSQNVFKVNSPAQLDAASVLVPDLIVQRYLSEEEGEYTAGTISGADRKVRAVIVLRRHLLQGTTYRTELIQDPEIMDQVKGVVEALGAVGICNVQFRMVRKRVIVFEINPRFSGTSGIRYLYGFNDPELMFEQFCLKQEIGQPALRPVVVMRYWNEVRVEEADFQALENSGRDHDGSQVVLPKPEKGALRHEA